MTFKRILAALSLSLMLGLSLAGPVSARETLGISHDAVDESSTDVYRLHMERGQERTIVVLGDQDTDLDVRIFDPRGRLVEQDLDLSDQCMVRFTPRRSGEYRIEIQNLGDVWNGYRLAVF